MLNLENLRARRAELEKAAPKKQIAAKATRKR
jgi:hypothetical protein